MSMLRVLKSIGFKFAKCKDGRRFLLERGDILAARLTFLRTMREIRKNASTNIYYLGET